MSPRPSAIALFLPSLQGGGAERVMLTLANAFAARGLPVDLVLARAEGPYLDELHSAVRLFDLGATRSLTALPGLARYLRQTRPAALLATMPHANLVAAAARRLSGARLRLVLREANAPGARASHAGRLRDSWMPALMRRLYPGADAIVAVSGAVADELALVTGLPRARIRVIYNPVITPALLRKAAMPLEHPWFVAGAPPVVLGVGRLAPQKGFADLIQAFALVRQRRVARLLILGEGPERPGLEALVEQLGLQDAVSLPGFCNNPYPFMAAAGVFVLPSRWEGLPGSLIEAMACGAPVVASDCPGGTAEVLENGAWGRLLPRYQGAAPTQDLVQGMVGAILAALADPAPADIRRRARCFAQDAAVRAYLEVLGIQPETDEVQLMPPDSPLR